jgi:hypothetical protein
LAAALGNTIVEDPGLRFTFKAWFKNGYSSLTR